MRLRLLQQCFTNIAAMAVKANGMVGNFRLLQCARERRRFVATSGSTCYAQPAVSPTSMTPRPPSKRF
jgi:hypothetical protein